VKQHLLWLLKGFLSVQVSLLVTMPLSDQATLPHLVTSLKELQSTTSNFVLVTEAKVARAAGNSCFIEARIGDKVRVRMPSGSLRELPANCRATIGVLAGHGRDEMPLRTAGAAYYKAKARGKLFPHVSGVAMNPVDHPHGGGNHQAVHGPNSVARGTPPGAKVGLIAPSRTGRGRGKKI
jgi:ribosomal protein L2